MSAALATRDSTAIIVDRVKHIWLTNNLSVGHLKFYVLFIFGLDYVGIGLAIVKRIVELHHGEVKVNSGNGITTFTVVLPKKQ